MESGTPAAHRLRRIGSPIERIVRVHGHRLAEALALGDDDPRRDRLVEEVVADVPEVLIAPVAQEAAGHLSLRRQRPL